VCGNGLVESGEECDTLLAGDPGCLQCVVTPSYVCLQYIAEAAVSPSGLQSLPAAPPAACLQNRAATSMQFTASLAYRVRATMRTVADPAVLSADPPLTNGGRLLTVDVPISGVRSGGLRVTVTSISLNTYTLPVPPGWFYTDTVRPRARACVRMTDLPAAGLCSQVFNMTWSVFSPLTVVRAAPKRSPAYPRLSRAPLVADSGGHVAAVRRVALPADFRRPVAPGQRVVLRVVGAAAHDLHAHVRGVRVGPLRDPDARFAGGLVPAHPAARPDENAHPPAQRP
jgi:hypothetical protein